MPFSPIKIANEFLGMAVAEGRALTPLQLIKLVYIANGWSLTYFPQPMINESAQAWQYGPVVPSLYQAVKQFRSAPVAGPLAGDYDPQTLDDQTKGLLKSVYNTYSRYSGTQLSNMTHMPDTPWSITWKERGQNAVIPNDLIKAHYDQLRATRIPA